MTTWYRKLLGLQKKQEFQTKREETHRPPNTRSAIVYKLCYFRGYDECNGVLYSVEELAMYMCEFHRVHGGGHIKMNFNDDLSKFKIMEGKPELIEAWFDN